MTGPDDTSPARPSGQGLRPAPTGHDEALAAAARAARAIRYGDIRLTIHEGRIDQPAATEKTRFAAG